MTEIAPVLCRACTRLSAEQPQACEAFRRIPDDIYWNGADHHLPVLGDSGLTFRADPSKAVELDQWRRVFGPDGQ